MSKRMLPVKYYKKLLFDLLSNSKIGYRDRASEDVLEYVDRFKNEINRIEKTNNFKYMDHTISEKDTVYVADSDFRELTIELLERWLNFRPTAYQVDNPNIKLYLPPRTLDDGEVKYVMDKSVYITISKCVYTGYTTTGFLKNINGIYYLTSRYGEIITGFTNPDYIFESDEEANTAEYILVTAKILQDQVDEAMIELDKKELNRKKESKNGNQ